MNEKKPKPKTRILQSNCAKCSKNVILSKAIVKNKIKNKMQIRASRTKKKIPQKYSLPSSRMCPHQESRCPLQEDTVNEGYK